MFNLQNVNVAYTGAKNYLSTSLIYRTQWVGFPGSPTYQNFSISMPIQKQNAGIGIQFVNDKIGEHSMAGAAFSYAYKLKLANGKLCFGLRSGIVNYTYHWDRIKYKDSNDNLVSNVEKSKLTPTFDFGTIFYNKYFFIGLEAAQLGGSRIVKSNTSNAVQTLHCNFIVGKAIVLSEQLLLKPSMLVRYAAGGQFQADINSSILLKKTVWFGLGYRSNEGIQFLTEIYANSQIRVGYSYDYALNKLRGNQAGSHEIFLGVDFNIFKNETISPRYF